MIDWSIDWLIDWLIDWQVIDWRSHLKLEPPSWNLNISHEAQDLILQLCREPELRLGSGNSQSPPVHPPSDEIKRHKFFQSIDWRQDIRATKAPDVGFDVRSFDTFRFDKCDESESYWPTDDQQSNQRSHSGPRKGRNGLANGQKDMKFDCFTFTRPVFFESPVWPSPIFLLSFFIWRGGGGVEQCRSIFLKELRKKILPFFCKFLGRIALSHSIDCHMDPERAFCCIFCVVKKKFCSVCTVQQTLYISIFIPYNTVNKFLFLITNAKLVSPRAQMLYINQSINRSIKQKAPSHSINQSIPNLLLITI